MDGFWRMPENISTFGSEIDGMFMVIAWITGIVFVAVEALLIYYMIKYRGKPGRKAKFTHGNSRMEILWTAATAVIVVFVGVISRGLWLDVKDPRRFPDAGLEVRVVAKQFEWNVTYPGADGRLDTADDFTKRNTMHVPVDVPVLVHLQSEDVIHSFYLPDLRLKQDAVPGMNIPAWFEATQPGEYILGCAELCGTGHYRMKGTVTVLASGDWDTWYGAEMQAVAAAGAGAATLAGPAGEAAPAAGNAATHAH